eukprot:m.58642 g.58642  ORF g.58642 m.58642 type:complete len:226 (+) comp7873_c0_seq2:79-756(+)
MSEWDECADGWEKDKIVIEYSKKAYASLVDTGIVANLKKYESKVRVLDFGCGTGLLTETLIKEFHHQKGGVEVVALDSSQKMIDILNGKRLESVTTIASELSQTLIEKNDCLQAKFDVIIASSVMAFVPNYTETLSLLKGLLKEGGHLVHWDWLKESNSGCEKETKMNNCDKETVEEQDFGLTEDEISTSMDKVGFSQCSISFPFKFIFPDIPTPGQVIMAVAQN